VAFLFSGHGILTTVYVLIVAIRFVT